MKTDVFGKEFREEFAYLLRIKLDRWKEQNAKIKNGKKRRATNADFVESVAAVKESKSFELRTLGKWLAAEKTPSRENFEAILKVLECERWDLLPLDHKDYYQYDRDYMNKEVTKKAAYAESIGLRKSFMNWMRDLKVYKEHFPIYREIVGAGLFDPEPIAIGEPAEAAKVRSEFQYRLQGKTILLHDKDLDFLEELQEAAVALVSEKMKAKQEQYDRDLEEKKKELLQNLVKVDENGVIFTYHIDSAKDEKGEK